MSAALAAALAPARPADMMDTPALAGGKRIGARRVETPAANEDTDDALALRTARGDQRAFSEIVRRHGGRLRALAHRFAGGAADADDIVQETFLNFWRTARNWQPGGPPLAAYLTRIAINRAIDGDRKRRIRRFFGLEEAGEVADSGSPVDARMEGRQALRAVMDDLALLPARQRAAILLSANGERSNADIGDALGLSVGAVEQLLVRARRTLRARLEAREGAGGLGDED
jgi:RNA polymerase sigma-70 factor (ECF subfamily)